MIEDRRWVACCGAGSCAGEGGPTPEYFRYRANWCCGALALLPILTFSATWYIILASETCNDGCGSYRTVYGTGHSSMDSWSDCASIAAGYSRTAACPGDSSRDERAAFTPCGNDDACMRILRGMPNDPSQDDVYTSGCGANALCCDVASCQGMFCDGDQPPVPEPPPWTCSETADTIRFVLANLSLWVLFPLAGLAVFCCGALSADAHYPALWPVRKNGPQASITQVMLPNEVP
jgi:hypothetical protein